MFCFITSAKEVICLVCLSVCQQDNRKPTGPVFIKLGEKEQRGSRKILERIGLGRGLRSPDFPSSYDWF